MSTRQFPDWHTFYRDNSLEQMPWFYPELDPDVEEALKEHEVKPGVALDLGTGPGTQAIALAARGFDVTATDISESAIEKASLRAKEQGARVDFRVDDILDTKLDRTFDLALDRGCFHIFEPSRRGDYLRTVARLLKPGALLFLKCFSHKMAWDQGPYRFTPEEIREIFGRDFEVLSIRETVYQGTLPTLPQALFCVLRRKAG